MSDRCEIANVLILSGPPGAGKTTVARLLTDFAKSKVVHLHTDDFFNAIRKGFVAPWLTHAHEQNLTVSRVIAASAFAYAQGGYTVVVDGVVGPWFLDIYRDGAARLGITLDYAVLRPARADAERRATEREDGGLVDYPTHIFEAFADLGDLERHVVPLGDRDAIAVARSVSEGVSKGHFRLSR